MVPRTRRTPTPAQGRSDRRAEVLALLDRGPLATREVAEQLGVDRLVCKMTLQRMKKVGLITSVGVTNGQRWALTAASRTAAPRTAPPPTAPPRPDPSREDAAPVEARDAAILQRITSNNGVATIQELRRWFYSKADINGGGNSEANKADALMNALLRLKAKGILARTVDVWSEVGRGAMRA
jgi:DNA-binding MarR family transcriptional regulator